MAESGLKIPIRPDLSPVLEAFRQLPGRTEAEIQAIGAVIDQEVRRGSIAQAFAQLPGVAGKDARKAANAISREMDRAANETRKSLDDIKRGSEKVFGGWIGDLEDVGTALGALGPAGFAVGTGLAAAGVAAAGLVAGGFLADALYEAADSTGKLKDENDALTLALESVKEKVGRGVAPVFEEMIIVAVAGALALSDLTDEVGKLVTEAARWYDEGGLLVQGVDAASGGFLRAASTLVRLNDETDEGVRATGGYIDEARALVGSLGTVAKAEDAATAAKKRSVVATKEQAEVTERHRRAQAAAQSATESLEGITRAANTAHLSGLGSLDAQLRVIEARYDEQILKVIDLSAANADDTATRAAVHALEMNMWDERAAAVDADFRRREDAAAKDQEIAERRMQSERDAYGIMAQSAEAFFGLAIELAEQRGVKSRAVLGILVVAEKLAAISSIGIATAEAAMKAIAMAPPPSPIGLAAAVGIGALGAIQAAVVGAQPQSFHRGGVVIAPDELMLRGRRNEAMLTQRGTQAAGGPSGVAALNRGEASEPRELRAVMVYQHRVYNDFMGDNIRLRSSPVRQALKQGRKVGRVHV